jgi:hypothetical protein
MASAKRPMPAGPRGGKLDFDYLTRKAHNPGRKKKQRDPFAKVRAARDAAAAERQQRRDEAEAAKKKALARRKKKAAQMRSAPGRLRGQLDDVLAKLESEERR